MNIKPGGKNYRPICNGKYVDPEGQELIQSAYFTVGDRLQNGVTVKAGTLLSTKDRVWKALNTHLPGVIVDENSELIGVAKGMKQILLERGRYFTIESCDKAKHKTTINAVRKSAMEAWRQDKTNYELLTALLSFPTAEELTEQLNDIHCVCVECVLSNEPDFRDQPSGLEDIYMKHNNDKGTRHKCIFLPKFHPELNPIERCWSKMKHHVRQVNNGSISRLKEAMIYGLSPEHLPLSTIRKYCRFVYCYYEAYEQGMDIVTAKKWLRQRRTHRGNAPNMDARLEGIYFPTGRSPLESSQEELSNSLAISTAEESEILEESLNNLFPNL